MKKQTFSGWHTCLLIFMAFSIFTNVTAQSHKAAEIILDASGSMNARLDHSQRKIDAAKGAVQSIIASLPDDMMLAFRAYGNQFPKGKKNCQDTELLVSFNPVSQIRPEIITKTSGIKAQGYTPITYVLELAAKDFPADFNGEKIIILVSDGKETCEGDPCVLAATLARNNVGIVIHTIGFGVDAATKGQLECIASATGGRYFGAQDAGELVTVLQEAVQTAAVKAPANGGKGKLKIIHPNLSGHDVFNAESGVKVGNISSLNSVIDIDAGIYNIKIGKAMWKSVRVKPGETTVLAPGWLKIERPSLRGHKVLDRESGIVHDVISSLKSSVALMPGAYDVTFGKDNKLLWPVAIERGKTTLLSPGTVQVKGAYIGGHKIFNQKGDIVGVVSATTNWMPLPPGAYTIEIDGKKTSFKLAEGQELVFERK